jgi:hypothetical protein
MKPNFIFLEEVFMLKEMWGKAKGQIRETKHTRRTKVWGTKIEFSDIVRKDVEGKYVNQSDDERNLDTSEKQAQEF